MVFLVPQDRTTTDLRAGPASGPTCSILTNAEQLEELRSAWSDLLARSSSNEPMLSPSWLLPWWRVFGPVGGRELRAATFWDGARLVGLAPFLSRRHWYLPGIPFSRLEPLGTGEAESERVYSEYINVICEKGAEGSVADAFVEAVVGSRLGKWDEMVIPHMDGNGPLPGLLVDAFQRAGVPAACRVTEGAPFVPLPSSWDSYLAALPASRRYFLKRTLRDFDKWAAGKARYHRVTTAEELDEARQILIALHNGRWSSSDHRGMFRSERYRAFHETVMRTFLEESALELDWLTVGDEPIAALYNFVWNGKVYFYQSGRKTGLPSGVRPGIVMQAHAIRRAIECARHEYDFLGGAMQYKLQLALASRPLVEVRAVRRTYRERIRRCAAYGLAHVKRWRDAIRATGWFSGRSGKNRNRAGAPSSFADSGE